MEITIDTTGIKDIERDGGLTLEEMASVIRPHPSFSEMITQVTTL